MLFHSQVSPSLNLRLGKASCAPGQESRRKVGLWSCRLQRRADRVESLGLSLAKPRVHPQNLLKDALACLLLPSCPEVISPSTHSLRTGRRKVGLICLLTTVSSREAAINIQTQAAASRFNELLSPRSASGLQAGWYLLLCRCCLG